MELTNFLNERLNAAAYAFRERGCRYWSVFTFARNVNTGIDALVLSQLARHFNSRWAATVVRPDFMFQHCPEDTHEIRSLSHPSHASLPSGWSGKKERVGQDRGVRGTGWQPLGLEEGSWELFLFLPTYPSSL